MTEGPLNRRDFMKTAAVSASALGAASVVTCASAAEGGIAPGADGTPAAEAEKKRLAVGCEGDACSDAKTAEPISYDINTGTWLFDPRRIVERNDVLYTGPSTIDWEAMPTGGGDLWTLVRCDGDLHLRLFKSDNWTGSLGEVRIEFGARSKELASKLFRQRLDLFHGQVTVNLGDNPAGPRLAIWGHPTHRVLIIEVTDPESMLDPARITFSGGRDTMTAGRTETTLWGKEINPTPAGPSLINTGMQNYFSESNDPQLGRGTSVVLGAPSIVPLSGNAENLTATMTLSKVDTGSYHIVIAGVVTEKSDPLEEAQRQYESAGSVPLSTLKQEHEEWWRQYWDNSFLCLESLDQQADWLSAAYHVHLYTLGCLNRGQYPHNYDGGGPILDWVQEVRFIFSPLYAANRMDMVRMLPDSFTRMTPYMAEQTGNVWGVGGLWVPECYFPWGHTADVVLKDDGRDLSWLWYRRDPDKIPYGLFELYNNHTGLIFTSGLEISQHFLTYFRYSGDEEFLRNQAYPFVRGVCEFISNILRLEEDGQYHLDPANALETWWMIRDPADTFDGIRAIFPEFIALSEKYNLDAELRAKCQGVLAALPQPSIGKWHDDGRIDTAIDAYAPAAGKHDPKNRINAENPALYRVYPFGLSGIDTPDHARAKRTFECRTSPLWFGWAMDAIWAARLGLADEACTLLVEHARRFNIFPYGGWHFNPFACGDKPFPHNRDNYKKPFLDAGGCSATALNEILLQSHHDLIRVAPAMSDKWSGIFRLRAEGGFLVAADIHNACPRFVEIRSLLGRRCRIANPWHAKCILRRNQEVVLETVSEEIVFETVTGETYVLERASLPVAGYAIAPLEGREAFWRARGYANIGLPGRD